MVACVLDTGVCNDVIGNFKKDVPEAVETACIKCTQAQKHIFHVFLLALKNKLPKEYEAFNKKYDSEGKHFAALEAAVANS
ncbi:unnamed protein product [Arctia plantaginis]|nr:unnamed protein product [Arctia plantaginis]